MSKKNVLKTLIDKGVLDYQALVLAYYHHFKLTEREAVALIKLHQLLQEKQRVIKPKKFAEWLSISPKEAENLLERLMNKGYLTITLVENEDGRETETFDVDYFLTKVIQHIEDKRASEKEDSLSQTVAFLEDALQKPLSALDIEWVKRWVYEENYPYEMIEKATLQALKRDRFSFKYIDHLLYKQLDVDPPKRKNKDALKDFHKLWEE